MREAYRPLFLHHHHRPKNPLAQMKPLFSKGGRREVYLPGDPRRREFEEQWRESGGDLAQLEGQPLEVDNGEAAKVGNQQNKEGTRSSWFSCALGNDQAVLLGQYRTAMVTMR